MVKYNYGLNQKNYFMVMMMEKPKNLDSVFTKEAYACSTLTWILFN